MLPDRGVHVDEDSLKPFRPSEAYSNYISMPGLGQAVTTLIKVYSIHMTGNVHINVIKNPETVVVELLLRWAYRPTTEFAPSYGDVFKLPSMMDDQHVGFVETQCFPEVVVKSTLDGDDVVRIEVGSDGGMVAIVLASEMYERCAAAFKVISPASDSFDLVSFGSGFDRGVCHRG
ncbi:hypothetical protein Ancab_015027 [Ancistrocladus abbreviatus]